MSKNEENDQLSPTSLASTSTTLSSSTISFTPTSSSKTTFSSSSSFLSLVPIPSKPLIPKWVFTVCQFLSQCLIWPFIGGIMYGIGEVTAREVLARKFHLGVPPSIHATRVSFPSSSSSLSSSSSTSSGRWISPHTNSSSGSDIQLTNESVTSPGLWRR